MFAVAAIGAVAGVHDLQRCCWRLCVVPSPGPFFVASDIGCDLVSGGASRSSVHSVPRYVGGFAGNIAAGPIHSSGMVFDDDGGGCAQVGGEMPDLVR